MRCSRRSHFRNEITIAMLIVGVQGMFDMSPGGPVVAALKRAAADLSTRLGHTEAQMG